MIICDNCSTPLDTGTPVSLQSRNDPYGELHWCEGCANVWKMLTEELVLKMKAHRLALEAEVQTKMQEYFEGLRNE